MNRTAEQTERPPSGTVTILATDVVGSTAIWDRDPTEMRGLLERSFDIIRRALAEHAGFEFKTVGDGIYAAFGSAENAVSAAIAMQRAHLGEDWGEHELDIRVGMATGAIDYVDGDYLGAVVNMTARVIAHTPARQILVSTAAYHLASRRRDFDFSDVGAFTLRGFRESQRLYAVCAEGIPPCPPILGSDKIPNNIFDDDRAFIGRDDELTAVRNLILSRKRLVTISGMGGIGKSTLARQVARSLKENFKALWYVPCEDLKDGDEVIAAIASVLHVHATTEEQLATGVDEKAAQLIVLDCFEGLVQHGAIVSRLVQRCPSLSVLVTSRKPLNVAREFEFKLGQMGQGKSKANEAIALFEEAAGHIFPDYKIPYGDRALARKLVVEVLEGIPLAIVLAAGRLKVLSLKELIERVTEERHAIIVNVHSGEDDRHASLKAVVNASFNMLEADLKLALTRLASFKGGFWHDDACAVLGKKSLLNELERLDNSSLLMSASVLGRTRFKILDTVREYLLERVDLTTELETLLAEDAARFAEQYAKRAEILHDAELKGKWESFSTEFWLEIGNIRTAIAYACLTPRDDLIERFGLQLLRTLQVVGLWDDFDHLANEAASLAERTGNRALMAGVLVNQGTKLRRQGREEEARPFWLRRVEICKELGDYVNAVDGLTDLVLQGYETRRPEWCLQPLREAYRILRAHRLPHMEAIVFVSRQGYLILAGQERKLAPHFRKARRRLDRVASSESRMVVSGLLTVMAEESGMIYDGIALGKRTAALAAEGGRVYTAVRVLITLADLLVSIGDRDQAELAIQIAKKIQIDRNSNQAKRLAQRCQELEIPDHPAEPVEWPGSVELLAGTVR